MPTLQNHTPVAVSFFATVLAGFLLAVAKKYNIDMTGLEPYIYAFASGSGFAGPAAAAVTSAVKS